MADQIGGPGDQLNGTRLASLPRRYKDVNGDGSEYAPSVFLAGSTITVTAGAADGSTITEGSSNGAPIGGFYDDDAAQAVDEKFAIARITAFRALHQNPRDASGTELFTTANPGKVASTPAVKQTDVNINVATGQAPINAKATILASQVDTGYRRRAIAYNYTGDKALTVTLQLGFGATIGLLEVLTLGIVAGNVTPQAGVVFAEEGAAVLGTAVQTGTAPTLGLAGSWKVLDTPADHLAIEAAVAAGPTTVGVLQLNIIEYS